MQKRLTPVLVLGLLAAPLGAQDATSRVDFHGFGGWSYGRTSQNNVYLGGIHDGDNRLSDFALNAAASPTDNVRIAAQTSWNEDDDGSHISLNYAFAEYKFSDRLRLRVGQVKHPFGIYTEVMNVGTVRPFFSLPQGVYGPVGFAGQSYKGIGLTGFLGGASRWTADYDVYAGGEQVTKFHVPEAFFHDEDLGTVENELETISTRNVIGGRFVVHTPVDGLSVGASAYTGTLDEEAANHRTVGGLQAEFVRDRLSLRSEVARLDQVNDENATGYYVEGAYRFTPHWQGALQYNHLTNTFQGVDMSVAPSLGRHRESVAGLNYWFTPGMVLKLDVHRVDGNRFSLPDPEALRAVLAAHGLSTNTTLVRFGGQFAF